MGSPALQKKTHSSPQLPGAEVPSDAVVWSDHAGLGNATSVVPDMNQELSQRTVCARRTLTLATLAYLTSEKITGRRISTLFQMNGFTLEASSARATSVSSTELLHRIAFGEIVLLVEDKIMDVVQPPQSNLQTRPVFLVLSDSTCTCVPGICQLNK